jgi:uncharacterized repeat protein (TIGR03803 family)
MKTTTSTEEVSSHPVEKGRCEPKKHRNSPVPENNRNGLDKKFLQIYGAGRKSRKRPTLVVGKKPYGKCQAILWSRKSIAKTPTLVVGRKPYGKCQMKTRIKITSALVGSLLLILVGRATAQTLTVLHIFTPLTSNTNSDGAVPYASLILSGNTLYGTTYAGGSSGKGTVFAVNTDSTGFTNLYNFTGGSDGANPYAGLVLSGSTLYGTAYRGGSSGYGTVFAIATNGMGFTK